MYRKCMSSVVCIAEHEACEAQHLQRLMQHQHMGAAHYDNYYGKRRLANTKWSRRMRRARHRMRTVYLPCAHAYSTGGDAAAISLLRTGDY